MKRLMSSSQRFHQTEAALPTARNVMVAASTLFPRSASRSRGCSFAAAADPVSHLTETSSCTGREPMSVLPTVQAAIARSSFRKEAATRGR